MTVHVHPRAAPAPATGPPLTEAEAAIIAALERLADAVEEINERLCSCVCDQEGGPSYLRTGETQR